MKTKIQKLATVLLILATSVASAQDAHEFIAKVVEANGGTEALRKLKDVSLEYTFRVVDQNAEDVSNERYMFNNEVSYGKYIKRQAFALPQLTGTHTQFFDGTKTVSQIDGNIITDQQLGYVGHALRKTNYYWFSMMFKLQDPGTKHMLLPDRMVDGKVYKIVEMTFESNIGESSDRFILYVNPETYLVDQFLFTATGFGSLEPSLMKLTYEKINGIYLSTYRKFAPANWDGEVLKESWVEQITRNVRFENGFDLESIQR